MDTPTQKTNSSILALAPALIIGVSVIVSTVIVGAIYYKARLMDNVLSVTGSAKMSVVSDNAKWTLQLSRVVGTSTLKEGYASIASDLTAVTDFLHKNSITDAQINVEPVFMDENYDNQNGPKTYTLQQTIEVTSTDVNGISALSKNISALINQGVVVSTTSLEYYYSKLPDARVSLLSDAIRDAQNRAQKIAAPAGESVGSLRAASSGVVQVLAPNSVDVSDYGSYDTSSIQKDITITVKASFSLR